MSAKTIEGPPMTSREVVLTAVQLYLDKVESMGGDTGNVKAEALADLVHDAIVSETQPKIPDAVMEPCVIAFNRYNEGLMDADEALCAMATALQIVLRVAPSPDKNSTPRTNAIDGAAYWRVIEHAQQLERELNAARSAISPTPTSAPICKDSPNGPRPQT